MKKVRVIQWTTGKVGKLALRAILDDPRLELAGVYAYSADKAGVDAGELCGRPRCGVLATNDVDALIGLDADTVIYTPFMADLTHAIKLLETGHDVISTNLFFNVGGIRSEAGKQLEAACMRGGSSLYITGINPGWINSMVVGMTAVCRRVDSVFISESADCSTYESAETWRALGISLPSVTPQIIATARMWLMSFNDALHRIAEALEFKFDDVEFFIDHATASRKVDLGWLCMEKDSIAAVRAGWDGKKDGRTLVQIKVSWYLTKYLNGDWVFDDDHYHLIIKGEPEINSRIRFVAPANWSRSDWDTMTALPAVNAILNVRDSRPGILTLRDVGLPCAPAGLWRSA